VKQDIDMKDNVLTYTPRRNDRLIQCVAADGMVRVALIDGTELVREARRVHGLSRVRRRRWAGS
jgi:redox-regulated HSP33 family molecular chaperone